MKSEPQRDEEEASEPHVTPMDSYRGWIWPSRAGKYGILTGMHMNKMYVLGTHTKIVTDNKPLFPLYNSPSKSKQLHVDRHRTKLLAFDYTVIYETGKDTPCDYGSHHPRTETSSLRKKLKTGALKLIQMIMSTV